MVHSKTGNTSTWILHTLTVENTEFLLEVEYMILGIHRVEGDGVQPDECDGGEA